MRNHTTDNMGTNLTADFRISGMSPEKFLLSFEGLLDMRTSTFTNFSGVEITETSGNILDEGTIYTVYHHSDSNTFYAKI